MFRSAVRRAAQRPTRILIACFPKSGSTYLAKVLSDITGLPCKGACDRYGNNEQDISRRRLRRMRFQGAIIQQHVKGTENNVNAMLSQGIRPIVQVRNLLDVVVSIHDHIEREDHRGPTGYIHQEYWSMSYGQRLDHIIRAHLPWYFHFFVSWREAAERIDILPMTYERFFADQFLALKQILQFYRIPASKEQIELGMARMKGVDTRLNKGVIRRGEGILTDRQKDAVRELAEVWRIDPEEMRAIGIPTGGSPVGKVA